MIISGSDIAMRSEHALSRTQVRKESLSMWIGERPGARAAAMPQDQALISSAGRSLQPQFRTATVEQEQSLEPSDALNMSILRRLYKEITGEEMAVIDPATMRTAQPGGAGGDVSAPGGQGNGAPARAGFGVEYDYYEARQESESTRFQAQGVVRTADGKEIAIELELSMSRQYLEERRVSVRAGDAVLKDPLVINFSGTAAQLTQTKFSFDIDNDGLQDQIAFVGAGSGFLALDKSSDGVINNGGELFGALTGNGFAELAQYDQDGNQWIDEQDSIYSQLRVWTRDASGNDRLMALGQAGVGAIYLQHLATPFEIKDAQNQLQGQVASTGLYLHEDGRAGSVQQVNLAV